jgi:D-xylose 1-dehydrogenase (NADP+, D-xylono-1,5-lactone-forming)
MVRWGLLGTAQINRRLIPAMRATRRSMVAAVGSRDRTRAEAYAAEWQIPVAHGSYDSLVRDPAIDAVYVSLPNTLHVEWTLRALDAGKHVLCEKPLALTPDDVDRIAAVAHARGRVVAEAFMYRHEPLISRILELLADGGVGPIRTIASGFSFARDRANDIRMDSALGGGSLWDIGCYAVSAVRLVAGTEPVEVFGWAARAASGVDQSFTGLLKFPNDLVATVHSDFGAAYRTWLEVSGVNGVLRVNELFRPSPRHEIYVRRNDGVTQVSVEGSPLLFVRQIEDLIAAVLDGRPQAVSLEESRGNAAALAALHRSAREGRPVQL